MRRARTHLSAFANGLGDSGRRVWQRSGEIVFDRGDASLGHGANRNPKGRPSAASVHRERETFVWESGDRCGATAALSRLSDTRW